MAFGGIYGHVLHRQVLVALCVRDTARKQVVQCWGCYKPAFLHVKGMQRITWEGVQGSEALCLMMIIVGSGMGGQMQALIRGGVSRF